MQGKTDRLRQRTTAASRRPAATLKRGQPVSRDSLADQIAKRLRQAMIHGEILPDQTLTIRYVAEAMGVSAMPVRQALAQLVSDGALEGSHGRAYRLPPLTIESLGEITEIRCALEALAAEHAAAAATPELLVELQRLCEELQEAADATDIDAYLIANARFHFAIYRAAGRERLLQIIEGLWLRIGPSIRHCILYKDHLADAMKVHWRMLRALEKRDGQAARDAVIEDLRDAAVIIKRCIEQRAAAEKETS